uniref:non-specific serine/threonine protein kinase n=1 Tax=Setaria digitata TaxID=48799 RepID=A0A915Q3K8_9BILA
MRSALVQPRFRVFSRLPKRCCQTVQTGPSKEDKYEMFRKLNEYASAGLWDDRFNKPKLFLFGKKRQKAYELHDKMTPKTVPFFQRSPYGVHVEVLYRLSLGIAVITIVCSLYVMLIPEEKRLKYKADLLAKFRICFALRTLHIATEQKHYKVRYCVKRRDNNTKLMLIVTALLNELIKCAELKNSHRILLYSSVFIFRHYLFVEYQTMAFDLEQILHYKRKQMRNSNEELINSVLSENVIGHILRKILKALSYLHKYALHNNLVARSIVVTENGDIKLTGFKWTILKNEDIRKTLSLRNNRFFGRPTQWAPEEALNNIEHYGPHTELWYNPEIIAKLSDVNKAEDGIFRHVGLLIPEMVTGETFHLTNTMRSEDVRQYAEQLSLSSELLRLWHRLMQPNYKKRPTIDELLERNISKIIKSISKAKIEEALLTDAEKYRVSSDEIEEPLRKWAQLVNYSHQCGASDITRLESIYLGMGRNEFFSSVSYEDDVDDENPIYKIDFRKVPNDLLQCVCIGIFKNRKKLAGLALTVHLDMGTIDMCTVVCRYVYKFVQSEIIGYIRISLEVIEVLKQRNQMQKKFRSWQIFLEDDGINKMKTVAQVQVIFDGLIARDILEKAEKGNFEFVEFNMPDSLMLEAFA